MAASGGIGETPGSFEPWPSAWPLPILPGDGVWVSAISPADVAEVRGARELLLLDAERCVLAAISEPQPRAHAASLPKTIEVLVLAPGTIARSRTEPGDCILLEPIVSSSDSDFTSRVPFSRRVRF